MLTIPWIALSSFLFRPASYDFFHNNLLHVQYLHVLIYGWKIAAIYRFTEESTSIVCKCVSIFF